MNRKELYLSYADDCQQMAYVARNERERLTWLDMAQSSLSWRKRALRRWNLSLISLVATRRSLICPSGALVGSSGH